MVNVLIKSLENKQLSPLPNSYEIFKIINHKQRKFLNYQTPHEAFYSAHLWDTLNLNSLSGILTCDIPRPVL